MDFISTNDAAAKWNISRRRVIRLASEGRIPGAFLFGKSWMIPAGAGKPVDGRTKPAKSKSGKNVFRFPFYMNSPQDRFFPPLSEEENSLRQAQIDFLACDFKKAKTEFESLSKSSKNICIRVAALYFLCFLSVSYLSGKDFEDCYYKFDAAVSENHPYRRELELLCPFLLGCLSLYKNAADAFHFEREYAYSPSSYPMLYILSFFTKFGTDTLESMDALLETNEINARHLENDGHFYEAQMLHILLFLVYHLKVNESAANHHLKKSLDIASEHHFIYPVADIYAYYPDSLSSLLKGYPDEFANRICSIGTLVHQSFANYMNSRKITNLYSELSKSEYQYVFYACSGYSNKDVAKIMHFSERTVANRYAEIYDKMEVAGKQELIKKLVLHGKIMDKANDPVHKKK